MTKYHYKVRSSFDLTLVKVDSKEGGLKPLDDYSTADIHGEAALKAMELNPDEFYVEIIPVEVSTVPKWALKQEEADPTYHTRREGLGLC